MTKTIAAFVLALALMQYGDAAAQTRGSGSGGVPEAVDPPMPPADGRGTGGSQPPGAEAEMPSQPVPGCMDRGRKLELIV
jgi:hypothetical protein